MTISRYNILLIILFFMATAFSFAVDERQLNWLLFYVMLFVSIIFFCRYSLFRKKDIILYLFFWSIFVSSILNYDSFRVGTVLYTLLFLIVFIYYYRSLEDGVLSVNNYIAIIRFLIFAYFFVLVIQQISVALNFSFIPNYIAGDFVIYKLNSLSPEPSHSARCVFVLMYSYVSISDLVVKEEVDIVTRIWKNKWIWLAFFYTMLSMGSGFAIFYVFVFLLKIFGIKKTVFVAFIFGLIVVMADYKIYSLERLIDFANALWSFDIKNIISVDHSASVRIVPTIRYLQEMDFFDVNAWIGYGTDYSSWYVSGLMPGIRYGNFSGGFFPTFLIDRGLIPFIFFVILLKRYCVKNLLSYDSFVLFLLIFAAAINTQLFWFIIIVFATNKFFVLRLNKSLY